MVCMVFIVYMGGYSLKSPRVFVGKAARPPETIFRKNQIKIVLINQKYSWVNWMIEN